MRHLWKNVDPENMEATRMIALSLPRGSGFGWATCGENLIREFQKMPGGAYGVVLENDLPLELGDPVLHAIQGVNLLPMQPQVRSTVKDVGYCFIEDSLQAILYRSNGWRYFNGNVVAGSEWGARNLRDIGFKDAVAVVQGVDTDLFRPVEPVQPRDPGRFIIYSGGKWEFRKGQDVAVKAAAVMMQRHPDVYLMCHWHNPWPATVGPVTARDALRDAKIPVDRISGSIDGPWVHEALPHWYSSCDVGLFPNRCEAGTNLVMMEFMACGRPVIATYAHGHADVLNKSDPLILHAQKQFVHMGLDSQPRGLWYEPDLGEVIDRLEWAYGHRERMEAAGEVNRQRMLKFTWASAARKLMDVCTQT